MGGGAVMATNGIALQPVNGGSANEAVDDSGADTSCATGVELYPKHTYISHDGSQKVIRRIDCVLLCVYRPEPHEEWYKQCREQGWL